MTADRITELQRARQEAVRNARELEAQAQKHWTEAARLWGEIYTLRQSASDGPHSVRSTIPAPTHAGRADGTTAGRTVTGRGRA